MINNLKTRIIPIILLKDGIIVRSQNFNTYKVIGNPFSQVERFNSWNVDELIYLDITRKGIVDIDSSSNVIGATSAIKRYIDKPPENIFEFIEYLSKRCFMPLTFGGGINDVETIRNMLKSGADKVAVNTQAFLEPDLIKDASKEFGSQSIVVSIDIKKTDIGNEVYIDGGKKPTGCKAEDWAIKAMEYGAGELLVNSIDNDGKGTGLKKEIYSDIINCVDIPVIVCGGIGMINHFSKAYFDIKPHAIAAANIFHFIEHSDLQIKSHMFKNNINVRTTNNLGN